MHSIVRFPSLANETLGALTLTLAVPIVLFAVTYGLRAPVSPESGAEVAMLFESYVVVTGN